MIPFSPPRIDDKIIAEVTKALQSGWITTGPRVKKFEAMIEDYTSCKKALCVSSGSAGLELILRWFGVGKGDEVILPAYTYAATANVILHTGAKPIFVDVAEDFNISVENINKAISRRTKVIMPVDIGGWPCDYDEINELVKQKNIQKKFKATNEIQKKLNRILVLSDAAHSLGATYKNRKTGSLSDITVFSFHAVKNLTTAEGGAVCLNLIDDFDVDSVYKDLNIKILHGQTKDALAKTQIGNWRYDIIEAGYKFNMTDIQAAMGIVELERYESDMLEKRRRIFIKYCESLNDQEWAIVPKFGSDTKNSSYHAFMLRIKGAEEEDRDAIIQEIFKEEVAVNVHFVPLPMMSLHKDNGVKISDFPNSFNLYKNEISLPVYYDLTEEQIEIVVEAVKTAVNKVL
jgi:dTDP-4-amino-4,6-dideoxygalactose transaminase